MTSTIKFEIQVKRLFLVDISQYELVKHVKCKCYQNINMINTVEKDEI